MPADSFLNVHAQVYPLDQLRGAQTEHDPDAAVYFLWYGPRLMYIGNSLYLGLRLRQHELAGKIPFNAASWLDVGGDKSFVEAVEAAYIRAYRPPFNQLAGGNIASPNREWLQ